MWPHTVTLYYVTEDPVTFEPANHITILRGVLMAASKAANVRTSGFEGADAVALYIPFSVEAIDGITGEKKSYIGTNAYEDAEDKSAYWTLAVSGNKCFFVKGEVVEPEKSFSTINANYDNVHRVTKVDMFDFGAERMQLWEVGGA